MRYITGALYAGSPPASPNFVIQFECRMEYGVYTHVAKLERKLLIWSRLQASWAPI